MQEHEVEVVEILERSEYKGEEVYYPAKYEYCKIVDVYLENENMVKANRATLKEAHKAVIISKNKV